MLINVKSQEGKDNGGCVLCYLNGKSLPGELFRDNSTTVALVVLYKTHGRTDANQSQGRIIKAIVFGCHIAVRRHLFVVIAGQAFVRVKQP